MVWLPRAEIPYASVIANKRRQSQTSTAQQEEVMPHFTGTDLGVLSLLTWKVRVAADFQLAAGLRIPPERCSAFIRRLDSLAKRQYLMRRRIAVAVLIPEAPVVTWAPRKPEPDWQRVAWQLHRRWRAIPLTRPWVSSATREAVAIVGGVGGGLRQPLQMQHDLAVTGVYVVRQKDTRANGNWIGEDAYRAFLQPKRTRVPDAIIVDHRHQTRQVIELGGLYTPKRLKAFHRQWATRRIPYEIW
jgi:hypothetical protein